MRVREVRIYEEKGRRGRREGGVVGARGKGELNTYSSLNQRLISIPSISRSNKHP